jgi:hypothetical protein
MRNLEAGRGLSFDPDVLDAFEAVAPELHRTICGAGELQVARILDQLLVHYFPAPAGAHSPRAPQELPTLTPAPAPPVANLDYLSGAWALDWPGRAKGQVQEPAAEDTFQDDPFRDDPFKDDPFKDDPFRKRS